MWPLYAIHNQYFVTYLFKPNWKQTKVFSITKPSSHEILH